MSTSRPLTMPVQEGVFAEKQSSANLDISESSETGLLFEKTFDESVTIGNFAKDLYGQAASFVTNEAKISADQANEKYSVPGFLYFNEPISPSLAAQRREVALKSQERNQIIQAESIDNNLIQHGVNAGAMIGAVLLDPINYANPTGALGSFLKAGKVAGALTKAGVSAEHLATANRVLTGVTKGSKLENLAVGTARGAIDVGLPNLISEIALHDTAIKNGYDYDVMSAVAFGTGVTGLGGLIGGLSTRSAFKSLKAAGSLFPEANALADSLDFYHTASKYDIVSAEAMESLITKTTSDLLEGKLPSVKTTQALLAYDGESKVIKEFLSNLESGKYSGIIDDELGRAMTIDDIRGLKDQDIDFKAWILNSAEGQLSNANKFMVKASPEILAKYGGKVTAKIIDTVKAEIQALEKEIADMRAKGQNPRLKSQIRNGKIKDLKELITAKVDNSRKKIDDLVSNTETKDYTTVSSDTLRSDYKSIVKRIKERKTKNADQFFNLSDKAKEDIYKLFKITDKRISGDFELEDLLSLSDEELVAIHQNKILQKELSSLTREDAYRLLKDELINPDKKIKEAARQAALRAKENAILERDLTALPDESFFKEIEDLKNIVGDDAELEAALKNIDDELEKEITQGKADISSWKCLTGLL